MKIVYYLAFLKPLIPEEWSDQKITCIFRFLLYCKNSTEIKEIYNHHGLNIENVTIVTYNTHPSEPFDLILKMLHVTTKPQIQWPIFVII